ncbi:hypothetical protein OEW28_18730 [Defluviimonas sp. WL0002]|uniref:Uncharacterized protein n=1 Tax=Albidovulum marisflavi TaxID=2984159 RepID=A0ABT2ZHN8_9RHOB|nr:hypothetical protein [Defluviimonas sp. WL0002]MCV2870653.1 hypothetical protein [Defluviimonas sp. WL0002]
MSGYTVMRPSERLRVNLIGNPKSVSLTTAFARDLVAEYVAIEKMAGEAADMVVAAQAEAEAARVFGQRLAVLQDRTRTLLMVAACVAGVEFIVIMGMLS